MARGQSARVHAVRALAVLPDGRVISGSDDSTVRVWDVQTGRTVATVYGDASFRSVACVDQHLIVAGDSVGNVWFIATWLRDEAGLRPFLDKWHLVPGEPWIPAIERVIEGSATVAVFCGSAGVSG